MLDLFVNSLKLNDSVKYGVKTVTYSLLSDTVIIILL